MKDSCTEMNIKQKVQMKIQQMNINIFSNQTFLKLIDCLFWLIQTKVVVVKDSMAKNIIHQKLLSKIITSLPTERTFTTDP